MAFDYKKEYKELYNPQAKPGIIQIPKMKFLAVRGKGNPNEEGGEYHQSITLLYGIAYTLRMSHKGDRKIEGYFEYVVPPLEGFWWQEDLHGVDYSKKDSFQWISLIRLPDFVSEEDVVWAKETASKKKKVDYSKVQYFEYEEGLVVQCMHIGPYDEEPKTVKAMDDHALENGYKFDISDNRYHHEIYISDPRKIDPKKQKTIIRHPIK
ncbi:MAG TPA: transcriptional regulator [Clostridiales bacterium]|nr:transcriptional regulator [Clostridiales bacterium]